MLTVQTNADGCAGEPGRGERDQPTRWFWRLVEGEEDDGGEEMNKLHLGSAVMNEVSQAVVSSPRD